MKQEAYTHQELAIDVGSRILAARVKAGLKQQELADLIGSTQPALARVERGRTLPSLDYLLRIAEALHTGIVAPYFSNAPRKQSQVTYSITSTAGNSSTLVFN